MAKTRQNPKMIVDPTASAKSFLVKWKRIL